MPTQGKKMEKERKKKGKGKERKKEWKGKKQYQKTLSLNWNRSAFLINDKKK